MIKGWSDGMSGQAKGIKKVVSIFLIGILFTGYIPISEGKQQAFIEQKAVTYGEETIHRYTHVKTGLKVVWIENTDQNTSFTLGVKTPTEDNTGVNHIIEHTLFKGSKKYPSSNLFFEANSQYPNLFMNAMTSSDMTVFPFCTPYEACFTQLLNVYLDSILNPKMLQSPEVFYEEAFHYNPATQEAGGVVYNEMKGTLTDEDRSLFKALRQGIYTNTHYRNDSGGTVEAIPTLTYQQFVKTYQKYYYPSNMCVVLYGKLPIAEVLHTLDSYFKERHLSDQLTTVNVDALASDEWVMLDYPSTEKYTSFAKVFMWKETPSVEEQAQFELWLQAYMGDETTPFMKSLQALGMRQIEVITDTTLERPMYAFVVKNIKEEDLAKVHHAFEESLKLVHHTEEDKDKEQDLLAKARLSVMDSQQNATRGIQVASYYLDEWSHGKQENSYFEEKEILLDLEDIPDCAPLLDTQMLTKSIVLKPYIKENQTPQSLSKLSDEEWTKVMKALEAWQQKTTENSLEKVPLEELKLEVGCVPQVEKKQQVTYMTYEAPLPYVHTQVYVPTDSVPQEMLPYLFLYGYLLQETAEETSPYRARVEVGPVAVDQDGKLKPYMQVTIEPTEALEGEQLLGQLKHNLLTKDEKWYEQKIGNYTMAFGSMLDKDLLETLKVLGQSSQSGARRYLYESTYPFYVFCRQLSKEDYKTIRDKLVAIDDYVVMGEGTVIGLIGEASQLVKEQSLWETSLGQHKPKEVTYNEYSLPPTTKHILYEKETAVDYVVCTCDLGSQVVDGGDYVAAAYMNQHYMKPILRGKHGAYGAGIYAIYPNTLTVYTYRDPDFNYSLNALSKMADTLVEQVEVEGVEMAKVEALGQMQRQFRMLDSQKAQMLIQEKLYLQGKDSGTIETLQKEILSVRVSLLKRKIKEIGEYLQKSHISLCTRCNEPK